MSLSILRKRLEGAETHAVATLVVPRVELRELFDTLDAPVEYEYALEETRVKDGAKRVSGSWSPWLENVQGSLRMMEKYQQPYIDYGGHAWYSYRIVQRPKPEAYTYVEKED